MQKLQNRLFLQNATKLHEISEKERLSCPSGEKAVFQQNSTFVKMLLEDLSKDERFVFKILSQYQLENYKLYAENRPGTNAAVENSVETV